MIKKIKKYIDSFGGKYEYKSEHNQLKGINFDFKSNKELKVGDKINKFNDGIYIIKSKKINKNK